MIYDVEGIIQFRVFLEVEAESEDEAMSKAKEELEGYYHLDTHGAHHNPDNVVFDLDVFEDDE